MSGEKWGGGKRGGGVFGEEKGEGNMRRRGEERRKSNMARRQKILIFAFITKLRATCTCKSTDNVACGIVRHCEVSNKYRIS